MVAGNKGLGCGYVYDRFGNRWQQNTYNGTCTTDSKTFTMNGGADNNNRMDGSGLYDAPGSLVHDPNSGNNYTYDNESRVVAFGTYSYVYDAEGRRAAKLNGSSIVAEYLFDNAGAQQIELDGSGNVVHTNVFAGGKLLATYKNDGQTYFHFSDWLGTQRMQVSYSGQVAPETCTNLPFGDHLICTGGPDATEHHFTGKERDTESGLDYFKARYYGSGLGRFMTPDWDGKPTEVPYASFGDPQTLNLYSYVENEPLNRADADGHGPICYFGNKCQLPAGITPVDLARDPETRTTGQPAQKTNGTVPVIVGQRRIRNWLAMIFSFGLAKHSYYIVLGHRFEVLGNPGSSHNQQVRETPRGSKMDIVGKTHTIYVTPEQAQALYNGSEYFGEHTGSGDRTSDYAHPCPTCTGGQEGYNFLLHNSNSFVYNMLNSDPAGRIPPPSAPVFTPGYAMKPDNWYPNP